VFLTLMLPSRFFHARTNNGIGGTTLDVIIINVRKGLFQHDVMLEIRHGTTDAIAPRQGDKE
jgi:hypothetical protein